MDLAVAGLAVRLVAVAELVQQPEQLVDLAEHFGLTQNRSCHSFYVRRLRTGNCRALFYSTASRQLGMRVGFSFAQQSPNRLLYRL